MQPPKPRNPHVRHLKRKQGAHGKTRKAERRAAKVKMSKRAEEGASVGDDRPALMRQIKPA